MANAGLREIRKALIYSSCQSIDDDALIVGACGEAGVIPIPLGSEASHRAASMKFIDELLKNDSKEIN
jgi:hypothetical protein